MSDDIVMQICGEDGLCPTCDMLDPAGSGCGSFYQAHSEALR